VFASLRCFALHSSLHVCLLAYLLWFACFLALLTCFDFTLLLLLLFFFLLLACTRRLASPKTVFSSRDKTGESKRTCIVINIWLFILLSLYDELVVFSQ